MKKRNRSICLRLTDDELEDLNKKAERSGFSREAYLRSLLKGVVPSEKPPKEFHEVLWYLRQIHISLNQVAAKANAMNLIDSAKYWASVSELQNTVGKLMEDAYG